MELVEPEYTYNSPVWHPFLAGGLTESKVHNSPMFSSSGVCIDFRILLWGSSGAFLR